MRPALLLLVLLALPHASGARVLTAPYAGQPAGVDCAFELPAGECPDAPGSHVQFGPFAPPPERVDVAIADAADVRVGAALVFHDAATKEVGRGWVCGEARKLPVPPGTAYVRVLVDTALTAQHCPNVAPVATVGTVTLRLR